MFRDDPGSTEKFRSNSIFTESIHSENGGGYYLSQDEVRGLVDFCNERGIEVIPEVPSLSHSDYLLTRHKDLGERQEDRGRTPTAPRNPNLMRFCLMF